MSPEMNNRPGSGKTALVTGASAGIGSALAREYAARGCDLVLVARREERLQALARELSERHGIHCEIIAADLADAEAVSRIFDHTEQAGIEVDILVSNAGYGVPGSYLASDWPVHRDFLQVMVRAVAELTHRYGRGMKRRGYGRIVNIASLAGHLPGTAGHTLYGAVKAWMIRFSESLAFELQEHGVHATAICPGFTYSEFHDVTGTREQVGRMPGFMWMSAEAVARQAVDASERGKVVYVNGRVNSCIAWLARHLPRPLVYRLVRGKSRDFRKVD